MPPADEGDTRVALAVEEVPLMAVETKLDASEKGWIVLEYDSRIVGLGWGKVGAVQYELVLEQLSKGGVYL